MVLKGVMTLRITRTKRYQVFRLMSARFKRLSIVVKEIFRAVEAKTKYGS